jgi:cell wall assembly regulator SMI1
MQLLTELLAHVAAVLPDYRDSLEEGYAPAQLAALLQPFEARIGTRLPPAYYALYEQFDGDSCGLALGWFFMSLGRAEAQQRSDEESWYASPDNPDQVQPRSHASRRLPLVEDYGGSIIYLDYDPAPGGTPGQLILLLRDNPTTIYSVAPSLTVFLKLISTEFKAGRVAARAGEEYLEFACAAGPYEAFWSDLSHRWRSAERPRPPETAASLARLSPLWREKIEQDSGHFTSSQLHRVRTLLVNDVAMLPDLATILLFPNVRTLDLYAHPLTAAHLDLVAQTEVNFLTLADVLPDLTPLTRIPNLRTLRLVNATVRSLAPLAALPHLETLELELVVVPDLRPLAALETLQVLTLATSRRPPASQPRTTEWPPLTVLGALPHLESLKVDDTNFADLGALRAFPRLCHVSLANCPITDFSAAHDLPDGLSFTGNGDFLEGILAVAPDKQFRFDSISGEMTDAQEDLWMNYVEQQRAEQ